MNASGLMVNTWEFDFSRWRSFPRRAGSVFASLKNHWGRSRKSNVIVFVVWSALITGRWVVVTWSKKACLGPAEIPSFLCLVLFKWGTAEMFYCKCGKWGDRQKKIFVVSNFAEALIQFKEEHQGPLKLHVPLGEGEERISFEAKK